MAALTDDEWNSLWPDFPNLVRADTLKTAPPSPYYNCIRFALGTFGTQGPWIDPPPQQADFIALCECLFLH
jgi:hypothetical protein